MVNQLSTTGCALYVTNQVSPEMLFMIKGMQGNRVYKSNVLGLNTEFKFRKS